jgi:hypothetical protein
MKGTITAYQVTRTIAEMRRVVMTSIMTFQQQIFTGSLHQLKISDITTPTRYLIEFFVPEIHRAPRITRPILDIRLIANNTTTYHQRILGNRQQINLNVSTRNIQTGSPYGSNAKSQVVNHSHHWEIQAFDPRHCIAHQTLQIMTPAHQSGSLTLEHTQISVHSSRNHTVRTRNP